MAEAVKSAVFEEVFQNVRKATETNLKMQQEIFSQWSSMWPGVPTPQSAWLDKMKQFRSQWASTLSDLAHEHEQVLDSQYKSALESLDAALSMTDATNPEELRRKVEQLCRKSLECVREVSESQIREIQDATTKITELMTKAGN